MSEIGAWLIPHMPSVFGLAAGTIAKFGLDLNSGVTITRRNLVAHAMMLGFILLVCEAAADTANCAPTLRAVIAACGGLLGVKLVQKCLVAADRRADRSLGLAPEDPAP